MYIHDEWNIYLFSIRMNRCSMHQEHLLDKIWSNVEQHLHLHISNGMMAISCEWWILCVRANAIMNRNQPIFMIMRFPTKLSGNNRSILLMLYFIASHAFTCSFIVVYSIAFVHIIVIKHTNICFVVKVEEDRGESVHQPINQLHLHVCGCVLSEK